MAPTTLGEHLLKRRRELGLYQQQVAERLGVDASTLTGWEKYGHEPSIRHWPAIIAFLGCDPYPAPASLGERLLAYRRRTGLTQKQLAKRVGVNASTIWSWENDAHPVCRKTRLLKPLHL